jgi:ABC-type transport system involved in multi-copper enzyme maturation permease subunit
VFLVYLFYRGAKYLFKYKPENGYILYGIILALASIILSSLTAGFINSPVLSVYFALLAAMLSALTNLNKGLDNGNQGYINGNK